MDNGMIQAEILGRKPVIIQASEELEPLSADDWRGEDKIKVIPDTNADRHHTTKSRKITAKSRNGENT